MKVVGKLIIEAIDKNDIAAAKRMMNKDFFKTKVLQQSIFIYTIIKSNFELFCFFVDNPNFDVHQKNNRALRELCKKSNIDFFKKLLRTNRNHIKISKIKGFPNQDFLRIAASYGCIKEVELMLRYGFSSSRHSNMAISNAYDRNHKEIVALLWKEDSVRRTLQKDAPEIYIEMITMDNLKITMDNLKNKVSNF